ncbi:hypothetical protein EBR21_15030, partial [bacterium]|nr:hypothetical protein [bacterium]
ADGEMATGTSFAIIDKGVPEHAAAGVAFTDGDEVGGKLAGDIVITKAANESDVTGYVVYFGSNATTKVSDTFIRDVEKTGSDLAVSLPSGTDKPANATHLLVFTRNGDGKMATPTSLKISDKGVPLNAAVGVSFKDTDINGNKIAGDILITKASDESDITEYEIYFGSDPTTKMGQTAITRIAPSGKNIMVSLPPEGIIKPSSASHLLVFTKNQYGQMATGVAVLIDDAAPTQVKSGYQFTCALMIDKTVRCWGNNEYGQLGDGTFLQRTTPTPVVGLIGVNSLHFGLSHVCALKEDKTVSCWGDNSNSQLGDGTNVSRPLPTKVVGLDSVSSLSGDHSHTCALLANKTVKCWGRNWNGQLGDGTFTDKTLPTVAVGLNNVDSLTSSCALLSDKTVKCWGSWTGNGSADNVATPAQVPGLSNVISMSQSGLNTCVVFEDKSVKCWGDNIMGELGDNTQVSKNDPTQVLNLSMVTSISTDQFLCAVLNNKTVKCWGSNFSGQVGDNTNQHKLLPVLVPNVSDVVSLSQSES